MAGSGGWCAFFAPVAFRVQPFGLALSAASQAYVTRLVALPAMRQGYADALKEPWREESHEAEVRQSGRVREGIRSPLSPRAISAGGGSRLVGPAR